MAMSDARADAASRCDSMIGRIDEAIAKHRRGKPADLSIALLERVRGEVETMRRTLDPGRFRPAFGRFILDWPDEHGLVGGLTDLAYRYGRLKPPH